MRHQLTIYYQGEQPWPEESVDDPAGFLLGLPRVVVHAADDDNLRQVITNGVAPLLEPEDRYEPDRVWFYNVMGQVDDASDGTASNTVDRVDETIDDLDRETRRSEFDYWGVDAEGRLLKEEFGVSALTVGDLRRAAESGYYLGDWQQLVVYEPDGLGGGPDLVGGFVEFLSQVGVEVAVGMATAGLFRGPRTWQQWRKDRRARRVAGGWRRRGLDGPSDLTAWIDMRTTWDAAEVGTRLGLPQPAAESLLRALGYDYSERLHVWTVGTSDTALGRRARWDRTEQEAYDRSLRKWAERNPPWDQA